MKNTITITMDADKLSALTMYMEQKNISAEDELAKFAEQLYQKNVPKNVRDFIEMTAKQQSDRKLKKKKNSGENGVIAADVSRFGE